MSEEKGVYKIYDNNDVIELPEVPLTVLIEKWKQAEAIKGGTNQDNDIWWGELCFQLTPLLVAENGAQAERLDALGDRCEVLQGAWTTRDGIATALEKELASLKSLVAQYEGEDERMTAEIKELKTDNKALREANVRLQAHLTAAKALIAEQENDLATWRKETKWGGKQ